MTKKNSLYFGLVDVDVQPNFKFSQVWAVKISIPHLKSKSDCALRIDKDEEIMDNSECPENEDLPVENTQSNNIIRLPIFGLACLFGDIGSGESTDFTTFPKPSLVKGLTMFVKYVDSCF